MGSPRILLAAGGTGGHMFPAQALAEELSRRDWRPALITDTRGAALAKDFPADPIETINAASVSPRNPFKAVMGASRIASGLSKARQVILDLKPEAVIGFGGYPAFPALAAAAGRAPIILHEQNAVLGRVNRLFAGRAAAVASGFTRLERLPPRATGRWTITGNPVREPVLAARDAPYDASEDGPLRLLVLGGSQGARILSQMVPRAVARLPEDLRVRLEVVQQTREDLVEEAEKMYAAAKVSAVCRPFFDDVGQRLADAHLVVARAGASTVTELAVVGRPSILVPLAIAMDDHQTLNARALSEAGAADVLTEQELEGQKLATLLGQRLRNRHDLVRRAAAARAAGRAEATASLADLVDQVVVGAPA
ncbi:MAG: undecaprenyldiphospho-muramoylpentapeptide beta-N-acetylglucosaminyltransferase [Caulobacterales bacterium]|nr:undecaprenyldiphospho-muramoylpentapeptide beta-N-acetylglucosaminyltransferase [Caulobacterales bacterium]